jgi:hypothetical protein
MTPLLQRLPGMAPSPGCPGEEPDVVLGGAPGVWTKGRILGTELSLGVVHRMSWKC